MQPASARSLLDALVATRDADAQRSLVSDSETARSAGFVGDLAVHIRECLRKDPEQGRTLIDTCFFLAERLGDPASLGYANRSRAYLYTNLKQCSAAAPFYEKAARLFAAAGAGRELGRTRIAEAENLTYLGDYRRAQALAREALRLLREHGDADDLARVHIFAGNLFNRLNRYAEALDEYDEARRLLKGSNDYMTVAAVEMNRGSPLVELNRLDEALESLETAREYCDRHGITLWADILDRNIARLHRSAGRYSEALRSLNRARMSHRERGDVRGLALCDQACAEIYLRLNLFREAEDLAERARVTFSAHSNRLEAAQCLCVVGAARLERGDARARQDFISAIEAFREEGNRAGVASMHLQLGRIEARKGNHVAARDLARRAEAGYSAAGLEVLAAYAQLIVAETLRSDGRDEEAMDEARGSLARLSGYHARWVTYQCRNLLAAIHTAEGRIEEAERLYREAMEDIESLRGDIDLDEFRVSFGKDKYHAYENLAALRISSGDIEDAFRLVERSRSRTLADLLEQGTGSVWQSGVEGPQLAVRKLREELNGLYSRLAQAGAVAGGRASGALEEKIRNREQALVECLREAASRRETWARLETRPPSGVDAAQAMLTGDETLIEYCSMDGRVGAFVLDRSRVAFVPDLVLASDLAGSLERLNFQLSKLHLSDEYVRDREELLLAGVRFHLEKLYGMLVAPLESRIGTTSLVIVPHGMGHYVPFQALYDGSSHLIDRYDFAYGASSRVLGICRERPERPGSPDLVLAVGDETTPAIREEAEMLAGLLPNARVLVGNSATRRSLDVSGERAGRLHIAAHGVFRSDNPMFSALKLGDGWLNMVDVFNLRLGSDLTTLSGCETGVNALYPGEELMGLAQAFLYAGTPSLVVSLWRVNDRSTVVFMKRFYEELLQGTRKPEALRQAALEVKARYPHPYYWAPFVLLGKS